MEIKKLQQLVSKSMNLVAYIAQNHHYLPLEYADELLSFYLQQNR